MTGSDFQLRHPQSIPPRGISQGTLFCTFPDNDGPRAKRGTSSIPCPPVTRMRIARRSTTFG